MNFQEGFTLAPERNPWTKSHPTWGKTCQDSSDCLETIGNLRQISSIKTLLRQNPASPEMHQLFCYELPIAAGFSLSNTTTVEFLEASCCALYLGTTPNTMVMAAMAHLLIAGRLLNRPSRTTTEAGALLNWRSDAQVSE